jgi:hypothetical protein
MLAMAAGPLKLPFECECGPFVIVPALRVDPAADRVSRTRSENCDLKYMPASDGRNERSTSPRT